MPNATGTIRSATAAAEPLDEPPGVCPQVVRVGGPAGGEVGELRLVDGLAEDDSAAAADQRHAGRVPAGRWPRQIGDP